MASCWIAFCMAISTFQLIELADSRGIQERGIPHARVDERENEWPSGASIRYTLYPHLCWPLVVPDYGSRIPGHK